jgi:carbohydrate kinase (thermoresistant glucokinase family)
MSAEDIRPGRRIVGGVILIVAGVAGSGKTTVGALLAGRLRWRFADADTFHPEASVAKMRQGVPLTDDDRQPWLRAIGGWMDDIIAADQSAVVTCSALKRSYREFLLADRPAATMVFLMVSKEELESRLLDRPDHFFPKRLLESQFAALEKPVHEERVEVVLAEGEAVATAAKVLASLWPYGDAGSELPAVM